MASTLENITKGSKLGHIKQSTNKVTSIQILLLELKNIATSISSESSLLLQKEANLSRKNNILTENHDKMIINLENLERELRNHVIKERDYLTKLEQMEADLARLENNSQSQGEDYLISSETVHYLETNLQIQTSVSQIYRGLLEKVLQVVPSTMSSLVSELAQNLIDQATLNIEEEVTNLKYGPLVESDKDWQASFDQRRETIALHSNRQAILRGEMDELENDLEKMLQTSKISQQVFLESQRKNEDRDLAAMRLARPKSSYFYKQPSERRPKTPVSDNFYSSEQFNDSRTDFALLKSKLKEIKNKII